MLLLRSNFCVYCGAQATTRDHFIPLARERNTDQNFEVPACLPCNATANARWFATFEEKATWLLTQATRANRVTLQNLVSLVPLVVEALRQHENGKNSAQANAATEIGCAVCGNEVERLYKHPKKFCSPRCAAIGDRDRQRRRRITRN